MRNHVFFPTSFSGGPALQFGSLQRKLQFLPNWTSDMALQPTWF